MQDQVLLCVTQGMPEVKANFTHILRSQVGTLAPVSTATVVQKVADCQQVSAVMHHFCGGSALCLACSP